MGAEAGVATNGRKSERPFSLTQDWPTLLWLVNFGCIELISWNSRVGTLDWPDFMVIDRDPQDVPFHQKRRGYLVVCAIT